MVLSQGSKSIDKSNKKELRLDGSPPHAIKTEEMRIREIRQIAHYLKTDIPKKFDHGLAFKEFLRSRAFII